MIYDILEYGAKADGVTNDAAAFINCFLNGICR